MDWDQYKAYDDTVQSEIAKGDFRRALEVLVQGYQHLVVSFCSHMLGEREHGQEVAQDVFLAAYSAMPSFRQQACVHTWLFAIARKQCFKALRDRQRRQRLASKKRDVIAAEAHRHPPTSPEHDPEMQFQHVQQGLQRLRQAERALLMMRYDAGLSLDNIADILGISETGVRRYVVRALQRLREVLADDP